MLTSFLPHFYKERRKQTFLIAAISDSLNTVIRWLFEAEIAFAGSNALSPISQ